MDSQGFIAHGFEGPLGPRARRAQKIESIPPGGGVKAVFVELPSGGST